MKKELYVGARVSPDMKRAVKRRMALEGRYEGDLVRRALALYLSKPPEIVEEEETGNEDRDEGKDV